MVSHNSTEFAPVERADAEQIARQSDAVALMPLIDQTLNAVNDLVVVLNAQRQIVLANRNAAAFLGAEDDTALRGRRPGEVIGCVHASEAPGGCGTSRFCSACGAVKAVLTAAGGEDDVRECRIARSGSGAALDLLVRATPLDIDGRRFVLCAIRDIGDQKRRRALERIFFHDVLNTAAGIRMLAEIIARPDANDPDAAALVEASRQLVQEINEQRDLMAAEASELAVRPDWLNVSLFLNRLAHRHRGTSLANGRTICIEAIGPEVEIRNDPVLLGRVLGNMVRNALEACEGGGTVTLGAECDDAGIRFRVHNAGVMSEAVQLQLFQRSFSTKGADRGLGTYSMKLLTERYLGGRVGFSSTPDAGTTFFVTCPMDLEA